MIMKVLHMLENDDGFIIKFAFTTWLLDVVGFSGKNVVCLFVYSWTMNEVIYCVQQIKIIF